MIIRLRLFTRYFHQYTGIHLPHFGVRVVQYWNQVMTIHLWNSLLYGYSVVMYTGLRRFTGV